MKRYEIIMHVRVHGSTVDITQARINDLASLLTENGYIDFGAFPAQAYDPETGEDIDD